MCCFRATVEPKIPLKLKAFTAPTLAVFALVLLHSLRRFAISQDEMNRKLFEAL
jgi:hypothetical protein